MIYNETVIDISLIVAYDHKFHSQNKKATVYRLLVCSFSLASITDVMSIFRRQQRFFPLFLLTAAKSALSILTVKCRVLLTLISSAIRNLTAPRSQTRLLIRGTFSLYNAAESVAWRPQNIGKSLNRPFPRTASLLSTLWTSVFSASGLKQQNTLNPLAPFRQLAHWMFTRMFFIR